jgi:hypothetical protein
MNRLTEWIDHGLKRARWPVSRAARIAAFLSLALLLAGVYLVQSSQIATTNRRAEAMRRELTELRRENALSLSRSAELTSAARMLERAGALGFQVADIVEFVRVPVVIHDDAPSLQDDGPER